MVSLGGNIWGHLLEMTTRENGIGELEEVWEVTGDHLGFLDLAVGSSPRQNYNAKIQEADLYFFCAYDKELAEKDPEVCRFSVGGRTYDVLWIDNPMERNEHLEIFLKFIGGTR